MQIDLLGDYKSNVAPYPAFHAYFRTHKPPFLAVCGESAGAIGVHRRGEVTVAGRRSPASV